MSRLTIRGPSHIGCAAFALLLLACAEPSDRPIGPGGGPVGPSGGADGAAATGWASGRLCEINSLTDYGYCEPLLNSGLGVSTFDSFADVNDDGTFIVEIKVIENGHVPIFVVSTDEWFGGAKWKDAEPGDDIAQVEIPVMTRATSLAMIEASGAVHAPGEGIVAMQAIGVNGVPLEDVDFGPLDGKMPHHGGPDVFTLGGKTSTSGTAVYFGITPDRLGFQLEFVDSGQEYLPHSVLGDDTFTIIETMVER